MESKINKKSFIIYVDMLEILEELSDEQAGQLFRAIQAYHRDDPEAEPLAMDQIVRVAFSPFKQGFDRDSVKYNEVVNRNRINGAKGGRPPKGSKPSGFYDNPKNLDNDNDNDNDSDNDNICSVEHFSPPSLEELKEYITQRGYTISAQSFIDYYDSIGWRVGKNPMMSWQSALSRWQSRDEAETPHTLHTQQIREPFDDL